MDREDTSPEACKPDPTACGAGGALVARVQALEACERGEVAPCREVSAALERREVELGRPRALAVHTRLCRAGEAFAAVRTRAYRGFPPGDAQGLPAAPTR